MDLATGWFVVVAVLWTGYLVLEGFDFGVGMLARVVGRTEDERSAALRTIGPVWDGNEVWLIAAVGAMFAAFPPWYAATFSGFALPLLAVLVALIGRGLGLEYRAKRDDPAWRVRWDVAIGVGSLVPAFVWGLVLAGLVRGLPTTEVAVAPMPGRPPIVTTVVTAGPTDLLSGYGLLGGLVTTALFVLHGALYLALRTDGPVRQRARRVALRVVVPVLVAVGVFLAATLALPSGAASPSGAGAVSATALGIGSWPTAVAGVCLTMIFGAGFALLRGREALAFAASTAAITALGAVLFGARYPALLVSTTDPAHTLTVTGAASSPATLGVLSVVGLVFGPLVLGYQAWSHWVFRSRIATGAVAAPR